MLRQLWSNDRGQDLVEYSLLLAFVMFASAALFNSTGDAMAIIWGRAGSHLNQGAGPIPRPNR